MHIIYRIGVLAVTFAQMAIADDHEAKRRRFWDLEAGEYHFRYLEAIDTGKLDPPKNNIPEEIVNDTRAQMYYQAGFLRGVQQYQFEEELKNRNPIRPCILPQGVFRWEQEGFIRGCAVANEVGSAIQMDVLHVLVRELQKDDSTPDSAVDAAIQTLEQQRVERQRLEQSGTLHPATKPADKPPVKEQPTSPTPKDAPR